MRTKSCCINACRPPFATRWPLEVHLLPHRQVPDLAALEAAERDELAPIYLRLLRGIDLLYDTPTPYIAAWHQAPVRLGRDTVRLRLEITSPRRAADKVKFLAGSEAAMGAFINDTVPEEVAESLRAVPGVPVDTAVGAAASASFASDGASDRIPSDGASTGAASTGVPGSASVSSRPGAGR